MKPVREGNGQIYMYPTVGDIRTVSNPGFLYTQAKEHGVLMYAKSKTHSSEYLAARFAARATAFAFIDEAADAGVSAEVLEKLRVVQKIMAP